ncbi:MAG TPA: GAF domain-containing sensor histidine kinase, partial [Candidatus Dormibacteraeota bacterium]
MNPTVLGQPDGPPEARGDQWVRGVRTLLAVSQHATSSASQSAVFAALTRTIARLTVARRAAFWALQPDSTVVLVRDPFGFTEEALAALQGMPGGPDTEGVMYDVLFGDDVWRTRGAGELEAIGASSGIVVPWRTGEQRLGLLGVYDSTRPGGFTDADVWVARIAAIAAGLVWQERQAARRAHEAEHQNARRLHEYAQRISELERVKSNVVNMAAQELRSPLGVIRGCLSVLEQGAVQSVDEVWRMVPVLSANATAMGTLIDDMVETARLEDGRVELSMERLDLRDLVAEAAGVANLRLDSRHRLIVRTDDRPVVVVGDRLRLANIIDNLVENAIKYSPEGGPVHCSVEIQKGAAVFRVIDRGIGIADEHLGTLFTRFGRIATSETSGIPGTGLGLFLCRELALMHGGDITVESQPGVGSAFSLALPRLPDELEPSASVASPDLTRFDLGDMIACSAAFRDIGARARSFEEAASGMVRHLHETLIAGETGARATALVRLFRAVPLSRLDPERKAVARQVMGRREVEAGTLCMALVGTAGEREEWCDPARSQGHRVIPLPAGQRWSPMLTRLVRDLGLDPNRVRDPELMLDIGEKTCNVFHVPEARDSPYVPAQEEFVRPFGIRSVLGFGGLLGRQDLYAVIIFAKAPIPRASAALFR